MYDLRSVQHIVLLLVITQVSLCAESCSHSLGTAANGYLNDAAFSASSENYSYGAKRGRLSNISTAWIPKDFQPAGKVRTEYLQVDLGNQVTMTGVATQGFTNGMLFVKSYYLLFGNDGKVFDYYHQGKTIKLFHGNTDSNSIVTNQLQCPVVARYIRFLPLDYNRGIALKVDVLGCQQSNSSVKMVGGFRVSNINTAGLILFWDQRQSDVAVYYLGYHAIGRHDDRYPNFPIKPQKGTPPISYAKTVTALTSCTKYKFILRIFDTIGCGIPEVHTLMATTKPGRPIPPQNFTGKSLSPGTITLSWEKTAAGYQCADDIIRFNLYYRDESLVHQKQFALNGNVLKHTITGLNYNQKYSVQIAAISSLGQSNWQVTTVDVEGLYTTLGTDAVSLKKVVSDRPNTIFIEWMETPDDITGISIYYRMLNHTHKGGWNHVGVAKTSLTTNSWRIESLGSWKIYNIYIVMYNIHHNISSDVSNVLVKGNAPFKAPENLTVVVSITTVDLYWKSLPVVFVPPVFNGYRIFYSEIGSDTESVIRTMNTNYTVSSLKPGTEYMFTVAAVSNQFIGPKAKIVKATTESETLPVPVIIELDSKEPGFFFVKWNISKNIVDLTYVLHYKENNRLDSWVTEVLNDTNTEVSMENLKFWQQYDVKIVVQNKGRTSESLVLPVLVLGYVPGRAPTDIKVLSASYHNITLEWSEIDPKYINVPLIGYIVKYKKAGDLNNIGQFLASTRNITVTGLKESHVYIFQIAGNTKSGSGVYSDFVTAKTKTIIAPDVPDIQKVSNISPKKIGLDFVLPSATITKIVIQLKTKKDTQTVDQKSVQGFVTLTVEPFTDYEISIKLCTYGVCSNFSRPHLIRTSEDSPSEVRNLNVITTADDVRVSWQPPLYIPGILRKYVIQVKNEEISDLLKEITVNDSLTYTFSDLPPYTNLVLEIIPYTSMPGPVAKMDFVSPEGLPGAPSDVVFMLFKNYISIKWKEPEFPNGIIQGYKIEYKGYKIYDPEFMDISEKILNATQFYTKIRGLVPYTLYSVKMYARTSKGYGEPAVPKNSIETPFTSPSPAEKPVIYKSEVAATSISIQLQPANLLNGPVSSFQIIIEELPNRLPARKRRSAGTIDLDKLYGYDRAKKEGKSFYLAAEVNADTAKNSVKFEIGDNKIYHGYRNAPLKPETLYQLYIRTKTYLEGKSYYGPMVNISLPKTAKLQEVPTPFPIPIPILIGVVAAIVFILVVMVIVILYIRSRRRRKKDQMDPYELGLIKVRSASDSAPERPASLTGDHPIHPDHPPIPVANFAKQVTKLHRSDNNGFKAEYNQLEIGKEFSWDIAHLPENKPKNRYANIVAYDHSRVILSTIDGIPGSDYINASRIDGFNKPNAYVSTQGPLPATFNDFWRMVWELRSTTIVMLTNLQEKNKLKCHKYWPDDCNEYGEIIVTLVRKEPFADDVVRTFKLEKVPRQKNFKHEIREVKQFHFTSWPDHGVPQHSIPLLNFRTKVRNHLQAEAGPTIVHCSAGVGRSGAYILIDIMLDRVKQQMDVDVFNTIVAMRTKRIAMVQTEDQYIFVHDAIVEAILDGNTQIHVDDLKTTIRKLDQIGSDSKVSGFEKQWKALNHGSPNMPKADFMSATQGENSFKNRFSTVLPVDESRVLLLPIDDNEASTYINAVYVDSFIQRNKFILTQSPLPKTISDFWRMVCEHGVSTVVMLNAVDEGDDYAKYWPDSGCHDYDMIRVEFVSSNLKEDLSFNGSLKPMYRIPPSELSVKSLKITDTRNPIKSYPVKIYQYLGWTETRVPNTCKAVISLITSIERWQRQSGNGPLAVMCSDGIGRSGTLAAIMYVLERVKSEQIVDVFQAIKKIRIQRPHAVKYMDQYKYIHHALIEYINAFEDSKL